MTILTQALAQEIVDEQGGDVVIPDVYTSIGEWVFSRSQLTSVDISDRITSIGDNAFSFSQLSSVAIGDSVTSIGVGAFRYNQLTSVEIGNSITLIGDYAFESNELSNVAIPDSVTSIGDYSFAENKLTSIEIGNSVTSIGNYAFFGNQLTSVAIPGSVELIGNYAFSGNQIGAGNQLANVIIPDSVTSIGDWAFAGNQSTSVVIPDSITSIGDNAFSYNQLTYIEIPDSVTSIGDNAFSFNPSLKSITLSKDATFDLSIIPDGVEIIRRSDNTSPTDLSISTASFNENIAAASVIATLSSTDPDSGDTFTYSLVSGSGDTDNNAFTIDGNKIKINASPDYDSKETYSVRLQTTDSGGLTIEKSFTFTVNDLSEYLDSDSDGFVDGASNYKLFHSGTAIDLTNKSGKKYSDASTKTWDAVKSIKTDSGFQVLLDGAAKYENKFNVWTTNDSGVITKGSGWKTGDQMMELGYEDTFNMDINGDKNYWSSYSDDNSEWNHSTAIASSNTGFVLGGGFYPSNWEGGAVTEATAQIESYDFDGKLIWADAFGSGLIYALHAAGDYVFSTGVANAEAWLMPAGSRNNQGTDAFLSKHNLASGELQWAHYIPKGPGYVVATSIASDNEGDIYISGKSSASNLGSDEYIASMTFGKPYVAKFDGASGALLWAESVDVLPNYFSSGFESIDVLENGNIVLSGKLANRDSFDDPEYQTYIYSVFLDSSSGSIISSPLTHKSQGYGASVSARATPDGGFAHLFVNSSFVRSSGGANAGVLNKYNSEGVLEWFLDIPNIGTTIERDDQLEVLENGDLVIASSDNLSPYSSLHRISNDGKFVGEKIRSNSWNSDFAGVADLSGLRVVTHGSNGLEIFNLRNLDQVPLPEMRFRINFPKKFNRKSADKITNFNPSTDTLEIDTDSFGIDSSATFAVGKNKKKVKKKLAKQDFDFLYDKKKGWLYFNENGADKGFGDGGIIAILKGAPELTSGNFGNDFTKDTSGIIPNGLDNETRTISRPSEFKIKYADKITNFNPLTVTLGIDTESFGIDSAATFAIGKNKQKVKKKLAKQDFDFLYDQKVGGLYFNENGSEKGFGDGGIIAILKGAPELTSENLEFI